MDAETLKTTWQAIQAVVEGNMTYSDAVVAKYEAAHRLSFDNKVTLFNDAARSAIGHATSILAVCPEGEVDLGEMGNYFVNIELGENEEERPPAVVVVRRLPEHTTTGIHDDCTNVLDSYFVDTVPEVRELSDGQQTVENLREILDAQETLEAIDKALEAKLNQVSTET